MPLYTIEPNSTAYQALATFKCKITKHEEAMKVYPSLIPTPIFLWPGHEKTKVHPNPNCNFQWVFEPEETLNLTSSMKKPASALIQHLTLTFYGLRVKQHKCLHGYLSKEV